MARGCKYYPTKQLPPQAIVRTVTEYTYSDPDSDDEIENEPIPIPLSETDKYKVGDFIGWHVKKIMFLIPGTPTQIKKCDNILAYCVDVPEEYLNANSNEQETTWNKLYTHWRSADRKYVYIPFDISQLNDEYKFTNVRKYVFWLFNPSLPKSYLDNLDDNDIPEDFVVKSVPSIDKDTEFINKNIPAQDILSSLTRIVNDNLESDDIGGLNEAIENLKTSIDESSKESSN